MLKTLIQITREGIATELRPKLEADSQCDTSTLGNENLEVLGRALAIREVDAGSCNACELEIHATNNLCYNLEGAGIKFVASPRHADMLLVTGPVRATWRKCCGEPTMPSPRPSSWLPLALVPLMAAFLAITTQVAGGSEILPVDQFVHGCPPSPVEVLRGIVSAVRLRYGIKVRGNSLEQGRKP